MKNTILYTLMLLLSASVLGQTTNADAFLKSYEFEYNKDYANAISSMEIVHNAQSYETNLRLGWLTYMNADYMKSLSYYKNAIKISPKSIEARLGIANPLAALQNWEEIITVYKEILAISNDHFAANYRLALIYFNKKKFTKANEYATKLSVLYPFHYNNNVLLGKINISLGKITQAKEYLNKALLYDPTSVEVQGLLKVL